MPETATTGYTPEQARIGAAYIFDMLGDRNRIGASVEKIEAFLLEGGGVLRLLNEARVEHAWCLVLLPKPFQGKRIHCGRIKVDLAGDPDPKPAQVGGNRWAPQSLGDDLMYVFMKGTGIQYSRLRPDGKYDITFVDFEDDLGADWYISRITVAAVA